MLNTRTYIWSSIMTVLLVSGCGGSSGPSSALPDTSSGETSNTGGNNEWIEFSENVGYRQNLYYHQGNIYTSTHYTSDGTSFTDFHTTDNSFGTTFTEVSYIDERGVYYLFNPDVAPPARSSDRWTYYDWAGLGSNRRFAGNSDYVISYGFQANGQSVVVGLRTILEFSDTGGYNYQPILVGEDNIKTNRLAPIGDNKNGTIMVTDHISGGWRSNDGGRNWSRVLEDAGYLDLLFSSAMFPDTFYAFGAGVASRSDDLGNSWIELNIPDSSVDTWVGGTVDTSTGEIVLWGDVEGGPDVLAISSDKGDTWRMHAAGIPRSAGSCIYCTIPDIYANEHGYFISLGAGHFLPK